MKSHPVADQVEELLKAFRFDEALQILNSARAKEPHNPDLFAAAGMCSMLQGREEEAMDHLGRAGNGARARRLARMLSEHLICRNQMAAKLRTRDDLANRFLKKVQMISLMPPKPVGITLSACLIVKNEEANLGRCLESLQGIVDEIVVVDTGSNDRTIEIARSFGATLGSFPWTDDFSAARNEALRLATGHWVLWIDADEELTADSIDAIRKAVTRPQFGGFAIDIVNYTDDEGEAGQFLHKPVRLFQRLPGVQFTGRIHEQIVPSLQEQGLPWANLDGASLIHYGYRPAEMEAKNKVGRAIEMLAKEVEEKPQDPFHWFNLANAYTVGEQHAEAEHAARMCLENLPEDDQYGALAYQYLSSALLNQGKAQEALEACDRADAAGFGGILNEFERSNILLKMGLLEDAITAADKCVAAEWPENFTGDYSIFTHKRQVVRGQILALMRRYDEAVEMFDVALAANPEYPPAVYSKAATLEKAGVLDQSLELFQKGREMPTIAQMCTKGAARVCMTLGLPKQAAEMYERAWLTDPEDYESWVGWAQAADAWGDTATILAAYEAFAQKNEPTVEILINWGRALQQTGHHERALNCFTEAIRREPTNPNAYFNCGDLLYSLEQYQDAAHLYEAGLRHAPLNADGWFVLGNCLARLGLIDGAKMSYEQAISLRPTYREAQHNLEAVSETAA